MYLIILGLHPNLMYMAFWKENSASAILVLIIVLPEPFRPFWRKVLEPQVVAKEVWKIWPQDRIRRLMESNRSWKNATRTVRMTNLIKTKSCQGPFWRVADLKKVWVRSVMIVFQWYRPQLVQWQVKKYFFAKKRRFLFHSQNQKYMTLGLRSKFVIVSITAIYRSMGFWHRRCLKFMILSRMIMCSIASWRRLSFRVCGKLSRLAFQSSISISSCLLKDLAVIWWSFAKQIDFRLFIFTDDFEISTSST